MKFKLSSWERRPLMDNDTERRDKNSKNSYKGKT
jgi:hypothetical protein